MTSTRFPREESGEDISKEQVLESRFKYPDIQFANMGVRNTVTLPDRGGELRLFNKIAGIA